VEESLGEVRLLAQAHGLSVYDARYLHLAMQEGIPLATRDKQLSAVTLKVGVKLVDALP
jgi:predicted nucleic acid-binding protein